MVKAMLGGEMGVGAILSSYAAEAATGQVELIVAETAIIGAVLAGKFIANRIKKRREERNKPQPEPQPQPSQDDQDEPEPADINDEQEYDENGQVILQPPEIEQFGNRLEDERQARIANLEEQLNIDPEDRIRTPNPDLFLYPPDIRDQWRGMSDDNGQMRRRDEENKKEQDNDDNNGGNDGGNNGGNNPNPGGNDGGNNGGNNGGGDNPNPNPNPGGNNNQNQRRNRNPYQDILNYIANQINTQKKKEEEEQTKSESKDATDQQKLEQEQIDNQHLIQKQIQASLAALGEQELTQEEMLVQLESIEQMIDDQIPDQVKVDPSNIFSKAISGF